MTDHQNVALRCPVCGVEFDFSQPCRHLLPLDRNGDVAACLAEFCGCGKRWHQIQSRLPVHLRATDGLAWESERDDQHLLARYFIDRFVKPCPAVARIDHDPGIIVGSEPIHALVRPCIWAADLKQLAGQMHRRLTEDSWLIGVGSKKAGEKMAAAISSEPLRALARDLLGINIPVTLEALSRWCAMGLNNGVHLAEQHRARAWELLGLEKSDPLDMWALRATFLRELQRHGAERDLLETAKATFRELASRPPLLLRRMLPAEGPIREFACWLEMAVMLGIELETLGHEYSKGLRILIAGADIAQRFLSARLRSLVDTACPRRPALVEFIEWTYPQNPVEREVMGSLAGECFATLQASGDALDPDRWAVWGFQRGQRLAVQEPGQRQQLLSGYPPQRDQMSTHMLETYLGRTPGGWTPEQIVKGTNQWALQNHRRLWHSQLEIAAYERIRHAFDFSIWMGVVAAMQVEKQATLSKPQK